MSFTSNFKAGVDLPPWHWLQQFPTAAGAGGALAYDGARFIYQAVQVGSASATTAGTSQLWQFDTLTGGWGLLATLTSGNQGMSMVYDPVRNVLHITNGAALTSWQVFNLNATAVTICATACAARALTTMASVLPGTASIGASLCLPSWGHINGGCNYLDDPQPAVACAAGGAVGTIISQKNVFTPMHVGMAIKCIAGTAGNIGKVGLITAVNSATSIAISPALPNAPALNDTFAICLPVGTSSGANTSSTLNDTTNIWPTNQYKNQDVVITAGTGIGQRRRIASNTAAALTLSAAVTGNANTGNWTITPDATSVYQIQPSGDFLFYASGNATATVWSLDISSTVPAAWAATTNNSPATLSGGSRLMWPGVHGAFYLCALRGLATNTVYAMSLGPQVWTTLATFLIETFTTGASSEILYGHNKLLIQKESAVRTYLLDLATGVANPGPSAPYAPGSALDSQRLAYVSSPAGVDWVYHYRVAGTQWFRVPIEWGD